MLLSSQPSEAVFTALFDIGVWLVICDLKAASDKVSKFNRFQIANCRPDPNR